MTKVSVFDINGRQHDYPDSNPPVMDERGGMTIGNKVKGAVWSSGSWWRVEWTSEDR